MISAIEFRQISKYFRLERDKPRAFQDLFISLSQRIKDRQAQEFWALKDVNFSVERGETVGLIGSNGSGKSTSLKLISRIIMPTAGSIHINGRVTALLELGAGFHPELSGRDNIFLNGTVMGLGRKDITSKVDSIIEFAELEQFIDVPVKNYSSGMQARLGFSVSVHLDPDILLIDEVLSVGDQSFQQKCSEHILRLRRKGITIFFVSHDLDTVARLCSRAIWLDHGVVKMDGDANDVTNAYHRHVLEESTARSRAPQVDSWAVNRLGTGEVMVTGVEFLGEEMRPRRIFLTNEPITIRIHYRANEKLEHPHIGFAIYHAKSGTNLSGPNNTFAKYDIPFIQGDGHVDYLIKQLPFLPSDYLISTSIYDWAGTHRYDHWHHCARFTVVPGGTTERYGLIALEGVWDHKEKSEEERVAGEVPETQIN